jgi:Domain of unknown function (DUF1906)
MEFRRLPSVLVILVSCLVVALLSGSAGQARAASIAASVPRWSTVTFDHVLIRVPASWPVFDLTRSPSVCPRLDRHAVYLGTPGPDPACPATGMGGKTEAVQLTPINRSSPDVRAATRRTAVGGTGGGSTVAWTNPDSPVTHTIIDLLPAAGVEVSLSYGSDQALIRAIQSSIRVTARAATARAPNGRTATGRARATAAAAIAAPLRPAAIPQAKVQGLYQGAGFDTCAAPPATTMSHWLKSPYRAIGIYIGGINRGCAQANLTANWITTIQRQGWHYFPLYVGLQASCVDAFGDAPIVASEASQEGSAAADDAAQQAQNLGIPAGTPLIYDMEAYGDCGSQVVAFLSAWDAELHSDGYQAGVYESFSNIGDLVAAQGQMVEPDVIHYADWDGQATTTSSYMPAGLWTDHQRLHQYRGGHNETWGGSTLNIDNDQLDVYLGGQAGTEPTPYPPPYSPPFPFPFPPIFRIALGVNSDGRAEWFAVGAAGKLLHAYQDRAKASGWSGTRSVGDSPANLASNPAVAPDQEGRLTVYALDRAGAVVHAWQQVGQPNGWRWGGAVGTGSPGAVTGDPAAIRGPAGTVTVLVTDKNGTVQLTSQQAPDDDTGWTAWTAIGGSCASSPVAYAAAGGGIEVFCITKEGTLASASDSSAGWQPWQPVGTLTGLTGVPAVSAGGTGGTEVFADTTAGALDVAWQPGPGAGWQAVSGPPDSMQVRAAPAVASWPGGELAVFSELADGRIGYSVQQAAGSATWTNWVSLGQTAVGVPAAWSSPSGTPEAAILDGSYRIAVASYAGSGWTSWLETGGGF